MLRQLIKELNVETLRSLVWLLAATHDRGKSMVADAYAQQEKY